MSAFDSVGRPMLHPLNAILLAFPLALFSSGLAADIAYLQTAEIQWSNFAAWAITGALIFGAVALVWSLVHVLAPRRSGRGRAVVYFLLLAIMCGAGLMNAFQHSRDGWSSVGALGLGLSMLSALAALLAALIGYSSARESGR